MTSPWEQLPHTTLARDEYRADVEHARRHPSARAVSAWRVDTLSVRLPHDPAWEAWRSGQRSHALDLVDDDLATMRRRHQEWEQAGIRLHRLVSAPAHRDDYAEFALAATRRLAGSRVRVIRGHPLPELTLYGDTIYWLRTTPDHIAAGAHRTNDRDLATRVRGTLTTLWDQAMEVAV